MSLRVKFNVPGVRFPFLQLSGNTGYQVIADYGLGYDSSWPDTVLRRPLWPYTLDYASTQFCVNRPCPIASIPKAWVQPIVAWYDLNGTRCATVDSCYYT